jgi:hypothetical protein
LHGSELDILQVCQLIDPTNLIMNKYVVLM